MVIPSTYTVLPALQQSDVPMPVRTATNAVENTGCVDLTFTTVLSDGLPTAKAKLSTVSSAGLKRAATLANNLIDRRVDDMSAMGGANGKSHDQVFGMNDDNLTISQIKPAAANSARLGIPTWVTMAPALPAPAGGASDFVFTFDRLAMPFLATSTFFVDILSSNDPDYEIEYPADPILAEIQYDIAYVYCVPQEGYMFFGDTGDEWYNNRGAFGDGAVTYEFSLTGTDDALYAGTMFFMTSMNSAAWNPQGTSVPAGFGFLMAFPGEPGDCGGCTFGDPLPVQYTTDGGLTYPALLGDLCSFAVIDTGQDFGTYPNQTGPSMGILVKYREVGAYGPDFGDFKLVVADIINRSATTPVSGLYYGNYQDWDISAGGTADNGNGDVDQGLVYENTAPAQVRGQIGLPSKGSYWPDGTKTDPMYNVRILGNADFVYNEELLDSLYWAVDAFPEGGVTFSASASASGTPADHSYIAAFGKVTLAPADTKTYGFAMWGSDAAASPLVDMAARAKFINKFAGFDRGDIDNNGVIDLRDLVRLQRFLHSGGPGPTPFMHLGDVNCDTFVDGADCQLLANYLFNGGTPPKSKFVF